MEEKSLECVYPDYVWSRKWCITYLVQILNGPTSFHQFVLSSADGMAMSLIRAKEECAKNWKNTSTTNEKAQLMVLGWSPENDDSALMEPVKGKDAL